MLSVAALAFIVATPAFAGSDAGGRKQIPAHGYAKTPPAVQHFKNVKEAQYNRNSPTFMEEKRQVAGVPYGDQPNKIPAKERYYEYRNGDKTTEPRVIYRTR